MQYNVKLTMISLQAQSREELTIPIDFGDKWPDQNIVKPEIHEYSNVFESIKHAIRTGPPEITIWWLRELPCVYENERRFHALLPDICSLFCSKSPTIETAAVFCVSKIAETHGKIVTGPVFSSVIDRIAVTPAIEYVILLVKLLPFLTDMAVESCVIPIIDKCFSGRTADQFAAAELLMRSDLLKVTIPMIKNMMKTYVFVEHYLERMFTEKALKGGLPRNWTGDIGLDVFIEIGDASKSLRAGLFKAMMCVPDFEKDKKFEDALTKGFEWAFDGDDVAIVILSKADGIVTPTTAELFPKIQELLEKLTAGDSQTRMKLPKIVADNTFVFFGGSGVAVQIVLGFGRDRSPDVCAEFLRVFTRFWSMGHVPNFQNGLFDVLLELMDNDADVIRERLCDIAIYRMVGSRRLRKIVPKYIQLMGTLIKWRMIERYIITFISLPTETILRSWRDACPVVFRAVAEYDVSLRNACSKFCSGVAKALGQTEYRIFAGYLVENFCRSPKCSLRVLFPYMVGAMCVGNVRQEEVAGMWRCVKQLANDRLVNVRAAVAANLWLMRRYFATVGSVLEGDVISLYDVFSKSNDPVIDDVVKKTMRPFAQAVPVKPMLQVRMCLDQSRSLALSEAEAMKIHNIPNASISSYNLDVSGVQPSPTVTRITRGHPMVGHVLRRRSAGRLSLQTKDVKVVTPTLKLPSHL